MEDNTSGSPPNHSISLQNKTLESRPIDTEGETYEANEQTYRLMSSFCMKKKSYELAAHYARLAEHRASIGQIRTRKRASQPSQHSRPMSTAVTRPREVGSLPLEFRPISLFPGPALTSRSKNELEQTPEAPKKSCRDIIPTSHQLTVRSGSVAGVTEDSASSNRLGGSGSKVKWNRTAFPLADAGRVMKMLLEGGSRTIQTLRLQTNADNYTALLYYVSSMKAVLENSDPWMIDNPGDFEAQWEMVERFIEDWHCDEHIHCEKQSSGALDALRMLEGAYTLEAWWQGMPRRSFWFFWAEGMRQRLLEPGPEASK